MSNVITVPGRTISTVTAEIRCLTVQGQHIALTYAVEIGKRLMEAKEMVPTGEWGEYLKNEVEYSSSTAYNFMQLYKEYGATGKLSDFQAFGNLTYSKALKLLAIPGEEREDFVQQHDVENLSVRQLEQAIKERDEARKAQAEATANAEAARAEARNAEQKLLNMQQQAAAAKSSESAWQKEIDKLQEALAKANTAAETAKQSLEDLRANPVIPASVMDKLRQEAESKAKTSDQTIKNLQVKLETAQKAAQISSPDATAFKLLFEQIQQDFNRLTGYLLKIKASDPNLAAKLRTAASVMLDRLQEKAR